MNNNELLPVVLNNKLSKKKKKKKDLLLILCITIAVVMTIFGFFAKYQKERDLVICEYINMSKDNIPPVIKLTGDRIQNVCPRTEYIEQGYKALDNIDGDITSKVAIEREKQGELEYISYTAKDTAGNLGYNTRIIDYSDKEAPILDPYIQNERIIEGSNYIDNGIKITDNKDENCMVNKCSNYNITVPGKYVSEYIVTDKANNQSNVVKTLEVLSNVPTSLTDRTIYLTFDDGPCIYTNELLDTLKANDVKATFFISANMKGSKEIIKRIYEEGHTLAMHSNSHVYSNIYSNEDSFFNDLNVVSDIIYDSVKIRPNIFRFAGGSSNTVSKRYNEGIVTRLDHMASEKHLRYFDWNVDSMDTSRETTTEDIKNNILNRCSSKKYSIVLQHDIHLKSVRAVDSIIKEGKAQGFKFANITDDTPVYHHSIAN